MFYETVAACVFHTGLSLSLSLSPRRAVRRAQTHLSSGTKRQGDRRSSGPSHRVKKVQHPRTPRLEKEAKTRVKQRLATIGPTHTCASFVFHISYWDHAFLLNSLLRRVGSREKNNECCVAISPTLCLVRFVLFFGGLKRISLLRERTRGVCVCVCVEKGGGGGGERGVAKKRRGGKGETFPAATCGDDDKWSVERVMGTDAVQKLRTANGDSKITRKQSSVFLVGAFFFLKLLLLLSVIFVFFFSNLFFSSLWSGTPQGKTNTNTR